MTSPVFHYQTSKASKRGKNSSPQSSPHNTRKSTAQHDGILPQGFIPEDKDILCGRGKAYAHHPGNKNFSNIVRQNLHRYIQAPKRMDKSVVVASVVAEIASYESRFVKKHRPTGRWYQMNHDQIHEKTGHAIRDLIKSSGVETASKTTTKSSKSSAATKSKATKQSKASQAAEKKQTLKATCRRRSSRRSTTTLSSMEPINVLAQSFCSRAFSQQVNRNFSLSTSDILNRVLEAQEAIARSDTEETSSETFDFTHLGTPPSLRRLVTDDELPLEVPSTEQENIIQDLDAADIFAADNDFLLNGDDDDDLLDVISVVHNADAIVPDAVPSTVPASIEATPQVDANDFRQVYELLSSDDESSSSEEHMDQDDAFNRMAAAVC